MVVGKYDFKADFVGKNHEVCSRMRWLDPVVKDLKEAGIETRKAVRGA